MSLGLESEEDLWQVGGFGGKRKEEEVARRRGARERLSSSEGEEGAAGMAPVSV